MNIFKEKKKLIFGILIDIFICIFAFIIFFFYLNNNAIEVSSSSNSSVSNNSISSNVLIAELENDQSSNEKVTEIVTDEKASDKELKEEKVTKKEEQKSTSPYFIKVNIKTNVVTIYKKDKDNKYTVPYKAMVCSTGTYTPRSGTYKTSSKHRWGKLIHDVYGQYATRIVGSILFHSVPYSSNNADTLLYEEYDKLGTTASAGCVRLSVKDCKWIYDNCPRGTMVEFYSSSEPGPLGKPTAQKISSVEECRNWDPTDPAAENPWHTYKPEEEKPNENTTNNITNDISNNSIINNNTSNDTINNSITSNSITNNTTNNSVINNDITNNSSNLNNNIVNNSIDNNTINNSTNLDNNIVNNNMITNDINSNLNNNIPNDNSITGNNIINNSANSNDIDSSTASNNNIPITAINNVVQNII